MRNLILNNDLKRLFAGVGLVAASGLLLGAAMHPDLNAGDVAGPQILAPGGGTRTVPVAADPGLSVYKGQVPEYVYGTDWSKPPTYEYAAAEIPAQPAEAAATDAEAMVPEEPPMPVKHVTWREPPAEPSVYPSVRGDAAYPSELPAPPPPPDDAVDG